METMKQYAKRKNVSYEAVRQQVKRYKKELENHISVKGKTQYLDEEAVAFLDSKRQENPVVVIQTDKDETIERLERENKMLLVKVTEQAEKIASQSEERIQQAIKISELEKQILLLEIKAEQKRSIWSRLFGKE